ESGNRARRADRAVAVDHEPRIALRDQMCIEMIRELLRDAGDADVPADVPRKFALAHAEIAELLRQQPAVMVRCQQERRTAGGIPLEPRRDVGVAEQRRTKKAGLLFHCLFARYLELNSGLYRAVRRKSRCQSPTASSSTAP